VKVTVKVSEKKEVKVAGEAEVTVGAK
jgi:hypothetical protein